MTELHRICTVLDKLAVDTLSLMEEFVEVKLLIEDCMSDGESHLAKARYIMGQQKVSKLQLPTEDGPEIEALVVVNSSEDPKLFGKKAFDLEVKKNCEDGKILQNPLTWFGVLTPQNVQLAQGKYRQALVWIVKATNMQTQINENFVKIRQLKNLKSKLCSTEE